MKYPVLDQMIKSRGIRKTVIAKRVNVSEKTLQRKIVGESPIFLDEANTIQADFFPDVPMETLFSTKGE